jgi:hypothetical protein
MQIYAQWTNQRRGPVTYITLYQGSSREAQQAGSEAIRTELKSTRSAIRDKEIIVGTEEEKAKKSAYKKTIH